MPRLYCPTPLQPGALLALPERAARHVQVLRLQPGDAVTLFDGSGGEWRATLTRMSRREVQVRVDTHDAVEREAARAVHLAVGMPANERMDWLLEKATELGAASVQPLQTERSVLRLDGERAERRRAHWQSIATAACEQCGRNRVPPVHDVLPLAAWLRTAALPPQRLLLSLQADAAALAPQLRRLDAGAVVLLCGPEGGLSAAEEAAARAHGFAPVSLGPRTLRAETAPLAALAALVLESA